MKQIKTFSDQRLEGMCSYCGNTPGSRDHVPSRILLEEPFPENLPVVPCCLICNQDFSKDEEYFATAIECIIHGSTNPDNLKRDKIKYILNKKQPLRDRIENSFIMQNGQLMFKFEEERFRNVVTKLAKGHIKFENSEPMYGEPTSISMIPLKLMTEDQTDEFFAATKLNIFPEIGSRAMQHVVLNLVNNLPSSDWKIVQENNYRYSVTCDFNTRVKIVIWEYLAVEIIWD